jgi:hypothetical protein
VVESSAKVIRYAPPVAGELQAVREVQGSGTPTVNVAAGFTGDDLTYSSPVSWVTVSGSTATIADELRSVMAPIVATNSGGSVTVDLPVSINPRAPLDIHVSTTGDDTTGNGALLTPFATTEAAQAVMIPGDTLILRAGVYDPFEVTANGTLVDKITVTTLPGENRQAIVRGDLLEHEVNGGEGVPQNNATRDGIRIDGKTNIHIKGIRVEYVWRNGIFIKGAGPNTVTGHHTIEDCFIQETGLSGILACGDRPDLQVAANDPFRTVNINIKDNEITKTNVVTDYNDTVTNSFGEPGGVGEAITVANSVRYVYVRDNIVRDSRQYGIDFKNHVVDGEITGNTVNNVTRFAIYLDAGELDVRRIWVGYNTLSNCRAGIVLGREEDGNDSGDDLVLEDIDIGSNVVYNMSRPGLHFQRHPKDDQNIGYIRRIRARFNSFYNTNTDGIYNDISVDEWASFGTNQSGQPVVSDIEFIGNLAWNPDGQLKMKIGVAGDSRFVVAQNFNVQDGSFTGVDPDYTAPSATPANLNLQPGSAAEEIITTASYIAAPFDVGTGGNQRALDADAGAYAPVPLFSTNIDGATVSLSDIDGTPTATISISGEADQLYEYDPVALAAGLPQFLLVNTITKTGTTWTLNDDGIYMAPADDLPDLVATVMAGESIVQTGFPYSEDSQYDGQELTAVLTLSNAQSVADEVTVSEEVVIQEAVSYTPAPMQANGGHLTRPNATAFAVPRCVVAVWIKSAGAARRGFIYNGIEVRTINSFATRLTFEKSLSTSPLVSERTCLIDGPQLTTGANILMLATVEEDHDTQFLVSENGATGNVTLGSDPTRALELNERLLIKAEDIVIAAEKGKNNASADIFYRCAVWHPAAALPDITSAASLAKLVDANGLPLDISLANSLFGNPVDLFEGPAAVQTVNDGSAGDYTTVGSAMTDVT